MFWKTLYFLIQFVCLAVAESICGNKFEAICIGYSSILLHRRNLFRHDVIGPCLQRCRYWYMISLAATTIESFILCYIKKILQKHVYFFIISCCLFRNTMKIEPRLYLFFDNHTSVIFLNINLWKNLREALYSTCYD